MKRRHRRARATQKGPFPFSGRCSSNPCAWGEGFLCLHGERGGPPSSPRGSGKVLEGSAAGCGLASCLEKVYLCGSKLSV